MSNETVSVGQWSEYNFELSPADRKIFEAALHGLTGVRYTPVAKATQVVAGTNYSFLSRAVTATATPQEFAAKVRIFQPLHDGQPYLREISRLEP
ncbi:hypothetical protein CKO44_04670 [Rubrivivax gelatinosus]|uniref:Uncharacterized protein n=1 Tax=Rubrivivax gelatinosus TaxID=28068 RepID=A0ABS1DR96_RUBGE|nr:hypothetical protein [Rubrivivax gelatinosus]MBK1612761.1 hypothetical protein [Rubrivivax gelatinosus]MBK1711495.1 hypothetical protein [Rubrivivax gelatinosus]